MWLRRQLNSLFLAVFIPLIVVGIGHARELNGQERWSGTVALKEPVQVMPGGTLTIAAGTRVTVKDPQARISVQGRLLVEGSKAAPVVFDGVAGWEGIEFMEAPPDSRVRWAEFRAAVAAISSFSTNFRVENSTFRDSEFGVRLWRESSPVIVDSLFENNQIGVANEMKSGAEIRGNRFIGHSRSAVLASHGSRGVVADNHFEKNKQALTLLQQYPDRVTGNRFIDNETGIYATQTQSSPVIERNHFERNRYAVLNFSFAYPTIRNNHFIGNVTAVHNDQYGSPLVEHNLFRENETALYNYRKSNPKVRLNIFEKNDLALYCDFSAYPQIRDNNFLGNAMGVKLGIYQSADWEKRNGSKKIMQRESLERKSQNPLLAKAPETFDDFVDVSGNWWGEETKQIARAGANGNLDFIHDRHDQPEVTYPDYGPGVYKLDRVHFAPWLEKPVANTGVQKLP